MRKRSESFYAKNEDDFLQEMIVQETKRERKRSKISLLIEEEKGDDDLGCEKKVEDKDNEYANDGLAWDKKKFNYYDDIDELGVNKTFQISCLPHSMEEDESDLISNLESINHSLRVKDKEMFIDNISKMYQNLLKEKTKDNLVPSAKSSYSHSNISSTRNTSATPPTGGDISTMSTNNASQNVNINMTSAGEETRSDTKKISRCHTFDNLNTFNIDFNFLKTLEDISLPSDSTVMTSFNSIFLNPIISKNLDIVDDVLKLVVIGCTKVGKSYFISKLLKDDKNFDINAYTHTGSFEIKKKVFKLLGRQIRLELWDTNMEIADSPMFNVYEKISDGFVLIMDPLSVESVQFVESQLAKIIKNVISPNILLIANIRFTNANEVDIMKVVKSKFEETDLLIKEIVRQYGIQVNYLDIANLQCFTNSMNKFLSITFLKKGLYSSRSNSHCVKKKNKHDSKLIRRSADNLLQNNN